MGLWRMAEVCHSVIGSVSLKMPMVRVQPLLQPRSHDSRDTGDARTMHGMSTRNSVKYEVELV